MNGIINIYKEQNMTSHDVVAKIRRIFSMKKVGHTGTLDPMAKGVLPVCLGKATRIIEYLDLDIKEYKCTLVLGRETDTCDIWGKDIKISTKNEINKITESNILESFSKYNGVCHQIPPIYSAIKIDGKKLYEYAREGKTPDIKGRKVYIHPPKIIDISLGKGFESKITFLVKCSKGTYIRSMCRDIGNSLGVYGTMAELERTKSGVFGKESSITIGELEKLSYDSRKKQLVSLDFPLVNLGELVVGEYDGKRLTNGLGVWISHCKIVKEPNYIKGPFPNLIFELENKNNNIKGLDISDNQRNMYKAYVFKDGIKTFIGVVIPDDLKENMMPHKIFGQL